ncbi:hypothetical protein TSAR_006027 [Trichomalopsis sarcophagae]|uniref:Uncharacterized protein n=1 Tax=Trichomalopsis sarcophagae TaxID=543379 RepID=A0A232EVB1_9HYME|nr:hypothetical protein TSAR_006027 [Trichomalopsis sarcophagae]
MMSRYVCIAITLLVTISLYIENSHGLPADMTDTIGEWIEKVKPESQNPSEGLGPIISNILKPITPEKPADSIDKDKAFKGGQAKNDKMIKIDV